MIKNKIGRICAILAVLSLVSFILVGAGAAAITDAQTKLESNGEAVTGTIVPGATVYATVSFTINTGDLSVGDGLRIETPFETPWEAKVTVKGKTQTYTDTVTNKRPTLDCINFLNVGPNATLTVTCSGTVPESAGGSTVVPLTVTLGSKNSSVGGTAQTEAVEVYNTAKIAADIVQGLQQIAALTQRIATYNTPDAAALGISFATPQQFLSDAENYLNQAQRSDISDYIAAKSIIEANNKIQSAEDSLHEITLQLASEKLNQIKSLLFELKELNINVDNISTKYTVYKGMLSGFDASTDSSEIDELLTDLSELYQEAVNKKTQAQSEETLTVLTAPNSSYTKGEKITFAVASTSAISATLEGTASPPTSGNSGYLQTFTASRSTADNTYTFTLDTASTPVGTYQIMVKENGTVRKSFSTKVVDKTTAGTLSIASSPSGATVYIDGVNSGTTPGSFPLNAGTHQIMIAKDGYENWNDQIIISTNTVSKVEATLKKSSDEIITLTPPFLILIGVIVVLGILIVVVAATRSSRKKRMNNSSYKNKMKCPYCGSEISEYSNFCSTCGRKLR